MVLSPAHLDILLICFCLSAGTDNWILSPVIVIYWAGISFGTKDEQFQTW